MGAYKEIVDFTFTANETSRAFTGLNITKDDFIKIIFHWENSHSSSSARMQLTANNENTITNYTTQGLFGNGTSTGAYRISESAFGGTLANRKTMVIGYLKLSENDRFNLFSNTFVAYDGDVRVTFQCTTSHNATFASGITSLTLQGELANGIGTGSRIQIYRLDAEKVADITVASNTTQVDISSLSIGKDDEYLLVSDFINADTVNGIAPQLMINDNTTATNYYNQRILGNGSTASAVRSNTATYATTTNSARFIAYSHIKVSEIGAYTSQNYNLREYGTSGVMVENRFISSTAENITSITKLNVLSDQSNSIGSGSRFILYKLK
jgi:hypothetical protein